MKTIWDDDDLIPQVNCPACYTRSPVEAIARRGDGLQVKECDVCGLLFVDPAPSDAALKSVYQADYFTGQNRVAAYSGTDYCAERHSEVTSGSVPGYTEIASRMNLQEMNILDVGCASGALLQALAKHGPRRLLGIDVARAAVEYGKRTYALDLRCMSLERAALPESEFDLITMMDVLEHVRGVSNFLREATRCLRPAGAIFICTPNGAMVKLLQQQCSLLYCSYEHLFYFSPYSLGNIAATVGLAVEKTWAEGWQIRLNKYRRMRLARPLRLVLEPLTAARNFAAKQKWKKIHPQIGIRLFAILRKTSPN
jgi:2-polyprenyl-3-methyl-5-hydroxy-6-metoxy-1,4-benzoquinol methylase